MEKKPIIKLILALLLIGALLFVVSGIQMHKEIPTEEAKFHQLQEEYFSQAKHIRDAAATNSQLNRDLVAIKNYPSELVTLKLVGIGKILTGIFILLFGILIALLVMPMKLKELMEEKKKPKRAKRKSTKS